MGDSEDKTPVAIAAIAEMQAHAVADLTAACVNATGISVGEMSSFDLFGFSARVTKGAMEASGLLKYIPLETSASEAAAQFAANCPDPEKAADAVKYAEFLDVGATLVKNFSPRDDDLQNAPEPISSGAKRWAAELTSPLHYLPSRTLLAPVVEVVQAKEPDEAQLRAIRVKASITETEAAMLLGMSRKALSNLRRARGIPRSIYKQKKEGRKVLYTTEALLDWANGRTLGKKSK
jgi:hypothetical protein